MECFTLSRQTKRNSRPESIEPLDKTHQENAETSVCPHVSSFTEMLHRLSRQSQLKWTFPHQNPSILGPAPAVPPGLQLHIINSTLDIPHRIITCLHKLCSLSLRGSSVPINQMLDIERLTALTFLSLHLHENSSSYVWFSQAFRQLHGMGSSDCAGGSGMHLVLQ